MSTPSRSPPRSPPLDNASETPQGRSSTRISIARRLYQQDILNRDAQYNYAPRSIYKHIKVFLLRCGFADCLRNILPVIKWLPNYKVKELLIHDFIAGTTVAVMHVPQGLAGALLAEAPPIMGLYMSFFPIIIYFFFGNSPHVSMCTFAVACLMAGQVVIEYAQDTDEEKAKYTPLQVLCSLSMIVGLFEVLMWCLRLGALSALLSEPVVSGFTMGAAFHVAASQIKDMFGLRLGKLPRNYKVIFTVKEVIKRINKTNWATFLVSCVCSLLLIGNNEILKPWMSKRCRFPVPAELILIIASTLVSNFVKLYQKFGVTLVGTIPTGLPAPEVPPFDLFGHILLEGFIQTMVTYTITLSLGLIFAAKERYEIDANQELLAMGASNIFASFFSCAPMCASLSRTYVQYMAGCKTLVTSMVSAVWMLMVLLWIGPFFEELPRCVLACIMVISLKGLFCQYADFIKFCKLCTLDAIVWLVTFLVTLIVDIDIGLAAGLLANISALFFRSQSPYTCLLGRMMDTDIYLDIKRYRVAKEVPGIKIFYFCGGLNFATTVKFRSTLLRKVGYMQQADQIQVTDYPHGATGSTFEFDPTISRRVHCVIIDASALSYVDAPGIKILVATEIELASSGIVTLLAGPNAPVQEMIERYNKLERDTLHLLTFPTVHDAVMYYQNTLKKGIQRKTSEDSINTELEEKTNGN